MGQIVRTARKVGRLFELTSLHFPSSSVSALVLVAFASIELWHSRLGHVSLPRIQTLVSRGLLGSVSFSPFDCMPCQLGNNLLYLLIIVSVLLLQLLILFIRMYGGPLLFPQWEGQDILLFLSMIFLVTLGFI